MFGRFDRLTKLKAVLWPLLALSVLVTGFVIFRGAPWGLHHNYEKKISRAPFGFAYDRKPFSGIIYSRHSNGRLARLNFLWRGRFALKEYFWFANGQIYQLRNYSNGRPHGEYKVWFSDGKPRSISHYRNGAKDGEAWGWNHDGSTASFSLHENGEEKVVKNFFPSGKPFRNYLHAGNLVYGFKGERLCDPVNYTSRR